VELSKADINTLSRFFRDDEKLKLAVKGKLKHYLDEYFDLQHKGNAFVFTPQSKAKLRADLESSYSRLNLRQGLPRGLDRLAVVNYINNDKLADIRPSEQYLLATAKHGRLTVLTKELEIPQGASLRLPIGLVDIGLLKTIIVIENMDVFDNWHLAKPPSELDDALVLYRGHERTISSGLKALLASLPNQVEVIMFPDLDPKGLENCFTTAKVRGILAPSVTDIQRQLIEHSQSSKFLEQGHAMSYLKKQEHGGWQVLISHILENKLAIMQQSIVALELPLVYFRR
jgi:hypothetical protein